MIKKRVNVTIKDVAKLAGVSVTTISNYLNKRYANMATATRNKIEKSIKELGYYPSIGAMALARNRKTKTVCIVIPHNIDYTFHHPYFAEVMRGLSSNLDKNHYRAMILVGGDRSEPDLNYLKVISKGIVDGFIFFDINEAGFPDLTGFRACSNDSRSISYFSTRMGLGLPRITVRQSWIN